MAADFGRPGSSAREPRANAGDHNANNENAADSRVAARAHCDSRRRNAARRRATTGPQYESAGTGTPSPRRCHCALGWRPTRCAAGTRLRSMRAASITRRPWRVRPTYSASSWARDVDPRHRDRPHRDLRCGQLDRRRLSQLYRRCDAPRGASIDAAIAQAAHDTLIAMFPSQRAVRRTAGRGSEADRGPGRTARRKDASADARPPRFSRCAGATAGHGGSENGIGMDHERRSGTLAPGSDRATPIALGAKWGNVRPFVLRSGRQFRAPPPPPMTSEAYTRAFNEVKALGGEASTRGSLDDRRRSVSTGPTTARRACAHRRACTTRS